ncbi:unnamed protein product [Moneuplotes crassus]|uniref:Phosphatidylinositol-4-phosphate 5-kinase n=1 Tax=Euplotes crassus TaxID=5936 RepID=A0AAD1UC10_EUPCR|nr:unnamed protein product [Moneuplotes crassus]
MSSLLNFPDAETVKGFSTNSVSTKTGVKPSSSTTEITDEYTMISEMFNFEELKKSPNFGIKIFNKAIYRGELQDNKRHGRGCMTYQNGRVYEGFWYADKRHGDGYEKYSNNNFYQGQFKQGRAHGKGLYSWVTGETYDGNWEDGLKQGYGVWKTKTGDSYLGEWDKSKAHGYGTHIWKNGDRYEGEWQNSLKHGKGTDIFANGESYTGQYYKGKPHGIGEYTWKNDSKYIGDFKNGLKHGKGKWIKRASVPHSNTYEGDYFMDKKHGQGVFKWASGNEYRGSYVEDERHGYGEMFWTDGSLYRGEWVKGIQHGQGEMHFPDGTSKIGTFDNNTYVAKEKSRQSMREKYEQSSKSLEKGHKALKDTLDVRITNQSINTSLSKTRLKPLSNPVSPKFSLKKTSTPHDSSFENKLNPKSSEKHNILPPLEPRLMTQAEQKRKTHKRGSNSKGNTSFDVGIFSEKALKLLEKSKNILKKDQHPAWRPSGSIPRKNGYNTGPKLYY